MSLSPGIKRPGLETYDLSPSRAEVKKDEAVPSFPHTSSWRGALLVKPYFT
jgi:hypothetical protein